MLLHRSQFAFRLIVVVILTAMVMLLARFPAHNGDLPFYIAAAFSAGGMDDSAALAAAAREISATLPAEEAAHHLENLAMAPAGFLDFYRIKAGYTWSIRTLHAFGIPYVTCTVIPSLIAFLLLGWTVFRWNEQNVTAPVALFVFLFLFAVTGLLQLGRISTPDPVSQCLLFGALYRIRFGRNLIPTLVCLLLALFFRPDNLPAVEGLLLLMTLRPRDKTDGAPKALRPVGFLAAFAAAIFCCILINAVTEPRFWWFRPVPYPGPADRPDPGQAFHFLSALARGPLPLLLALSAIISRVTEFPPFVRNTLLFLLLMLPVRYLLFPHYEDRFFVAFYLAGFCTLSGCCVPRRPTSSNLGV